MGESEYDRLYALAEREFAQRRSRGGVLPFYIAYGQRGQRVR